MIKNKSLILSIAGVFALVLMLGIASAVALSSWSLTTNGTASSVDTNINAGTFISSGVLFNSFDTTDGANAENWPIINSVDTAKYFEVTIAPKTGNTLTISDISFAYSASITGPASFQLQYSKQSAFASPTSIVTKTDVSSVEKTSSNISLNIQVNSGETLTLRWFGYNFNAATNEFHIKNLNIQGTVTQPAMPEEILACRTTAGIAGNTNADLKIKIDDINVDGFGKDEEWLPLDEISLDIKVENDNRDEKIDNIVVGWGLYNVDADEWYIDDEESDFDLKKKDDKTITITFKLNKNIDELADGDYTLYVWANGEIDTPTADNVEICASNSQEIVPQIETDFVVLNDIKFASPVECGMDVQISADVWNMGSDQQDAVLVVIQNTELGITKKVEIGDINEFDNEKLDTTIKIPQDAKEKSYDFEFSVLDENGDIYINDYDDDKSKILIPLKVEGGCSVESKAVVSASLESGGKAGQDLVIKATVTNTGTKSVTYTLNADGYTSWATLASTTPITLVLNSGEAAEALLTFKVNSDAAGEQTFNIEVLSGTNLILKQPVSVSIESSGGFSGFNLGNNWYLWAIGALNVILVIVIIIIAVRVAKS